MPFYQINRKFDQLLVHIRSHPEVNIHVSGGTNSIPWHSLFSYTKVLVSIDFRFEMLENIIRLLKIKLGGGGGGGYKLWSLFKEI